MNTPFKIVISHVVLQTIAASVTAVTDEELPSLNERKQRFKQIAAAVFDHLGRFGSISPAPASVDFVHSLSVQFT